MEWLEFKGKTVDEALTNAVTHFGVTSDQIEYNVVERGSEGFLGFGKKPAIIRAKVQERKEEMSVSNVASEVTEEASISETENIADDVQEKVVAFAQELFDKMGVNTTVNLNYEEDNRLMYMDVSGEELGMLIGKHGQTLDALQYLISLYVNKISNTYIRFHLDVENYRERRKATLENLAKSIAYKVKTTRRSVTLEPMNPYERRIIHSTLQHESEICTKSEGEEPYRKVVIMLKK